MCGIIGFWDRKGIIADPTSVLESGTQSLAHRGPDGFGVWGAPDQRIHFGHRRLSILDLSDEGKQPMSSPSGRYVLTYNGEIYNHLELRKELKGRDNSFRGTSDTETLLCGIEEWGLKTCLQKCHGMFAFALWDCLENRLSLVRDRIGIKPLYIGEWDGMVGFASETRALRHIPHFPDEIDSEALRLLLQLMYIPAPWSIYRSVRKQLPGSIVEFSMDPGKAPQVHFFWSLRNMIETTTPAEHSNPEEAIEELDRILRACVSDRMISDVPLGAFLSGGTDSSCVVAAMQSQSSRPTKTFGIGFSEPKYDESTYARRVAQHLGTDHTEMIMTPQDCMETIPELPRIFDEPFADSSQIPTLLVSRLARQDVTVALSGDGGDESFFGYNRYLWQLEYFRKIRPWPKPAVELAGQLLRRTPMRLGDAVAPILKRLAPKSLARNPDGDFLRKLADYLIVDTPAATITKLSTKWLDPSPVLVHGATDCLTPFPLDLIFQSDSDLATYMMYADHCGYVPNDLMVKVDRTTMSAGLEARVPFLDHRMIEFAYGMPISFKFRNGQTKWMLKEVLRRYLPDELIDRPKMGFEIPIGEWLSGSLRQWAGDLLSPESLRRSDVFHPDLVESMWNEHCGSKRRWTYRLWAILMFQAWHQQ